MEPRQQHGGLGPRPGLRSSMGDVPSCQDRQAPWGLGGGAGFRLRSCGTAGSGRSQGAPVLHRPGRVSIPPRMLHWSYCPSPGLRSCGVGRGEDGISSTALL